MELYCSRCCMTNHTIQVVIRCGHSFCKQCLLFLYTNNKRNCLYNCLEKIKGLEDTLHIMFENTMTY